MVIIISYNKQTWNEYNDSQTADENLANGAIISADRLNNMETGISNNDTNKVTDNKDGTEQLNGVKVQPFNKLSDTIGGRNMATNLGDVLITPVDDSIEWSTTTIGAVTPEFFKITNQGTTQPITISFEISTPDDPTKTNLFDRIKIDGGAWGIDDAIGSDYFSVLGFKWLEIGNNVWKGTYNLQFNRYSEVPDSSKPNINLMQTKLNKTSKNFTVLGNSLCLYWGTQATDWTPAPEDKINVSDMRKPASDVAGIEEVNAKQDKIGYTPADDSKVVHDNHDGTININGDSFTPALLDSAKDKNSQPIDTDVDTLVKPRLYYVSGSAPNNPFKALMMLETKIQYDSNGFKETQISYKLGGKSEIATRFVVPNGDLTGFYGGSTWVFLSDDSTVAHLSGANNFDTVPTYGTNNKPFAINDTGATTARPTGQAVGYQYFDTTLNKPIWYNGANWVDSTGTTV